MINWVDFNNKSLRDFGVYISGSGVFDAPERDETSVSVAGRNGELTLDNGRYKNITVEYPAFIIRDFKRNVQGLRNFLLSNRGYYRLEDTYHPEEFRIAKWDGKFTADPVDELYAANFTLTFDCYPQRFLKIGEMPIEFTAAGSIFNDYLQEAKPLIRAYGTGSFTIGDCTVTINSANVYTDIDSDLEECYKDNLSTNCNGNVTLTSGTFPTLPSGENDISMSGITKLIIYPRWWIL